MVGGFKDLLYSSPEQEYQGYLTFQFSWLHLFKMDAFYEIN